MNSCCGSQMMIEFVHDYKGIIKNIRIYAINFTFSLDIYCVDCPSLSFDRTNNNLGRFDLI